MNITLQGTNLALTSALRAFVDEKIQDCFRALGDLNLEPVHVHIELERTTRRHPQEREEEQLYRAEANVTLPGRLIRAEASAPEIEQAVVQLKHTLTREIRTWHERVIDEARRGGRQAKAMLSEEPVEPLEGIEVEQREEMDAAGAWEAEERERAWQEEAEAWEARERGSEDERRP